MPPILLNKQYAEPTVFTAENLLREARRQKLLTRVHVPRICVLDPDGDIVRWLVRTQGIERHAEWACYHTDLYEFTHEDTGLGIIGCAVGASFAVLIAEELFASGCELLISVTSAGQIVHIGRPPYFILIEKALRDEGTSYHYLPPADFSYIAPKLLTMLDDVFSTSPVAVHRGATWTTDAPFRETETAIAHSRDLGILAVEMEAAALYAFAEARQKAVVCFAHVTNQMARAEEDFEKGADGGSQNALQMVALAANAWLNDQAS
ncbi:MAG: nucleoside phosphorylase [Gemmatimonadetes bacterium]|jgi:uridine phosphorylase|nr:nucleoside phosphorylase [Gemmatimonadota bacterium]